LKKILIFCILLLSIISISAVSATENISDVQIDDFGRNNDISPDKGFSENTNLKTGEDNQNNENIKLEQYGTEITQQKNNSNSDNKKEFDVNFRNTEMVYKLNEYYVIVETPIVDKENIKFYYDDVETSLEIYEYGSLDDRLEFFIHPNNITIGTHTLKGEFKGDENYMANTITQTIIKNANFFCFYFEKGYCRLELPEDAKGNLVLYINNEKYDQVKLENGFAELEFMLKPDNYTATIKYDGDDYPVNDETYSITTKPYVNIAGVQNSINMTILFYENATGTFSIINENTQEQIAEVSLIKGEANLELELNQFTNNFIVKYNGDEYNYSTKKSYSWEPVIDKSYRVGPGSYVSIDIGKNTTGIAEILLYECQDNREGVLWQRTIPLNKINYTNGQGIIYLPNLSGGIYMFYITINDETYGNWSQYLYAEVEPTISIPEEVYDVGEISFELYKANGNLFVYIDNELYTIKHVENGKATINFGGLNYGQHYITLYFNSTNIEDIEFYENLTLFSYAPPEPYYDDPSGGTYLNFHYLCHYRRYESSQKIFYSGPVSIKADDVNLGNSAFINVKAQDSAKNVSITILNNTYDLNSTELNLSLPNLDLGKYNITIRFIENNTAHQFYKTFNVIGPGSFYELGELIKNTHEYTTLKLTNDYINTGFEKEITFRHTLTVDGNGHTIDANNTSQIISLYIDYTKHQTIDVTFKNINFKNAKGNKGGAFYIFCEEPQIAHVSLKLINCTFTQCHANQGGAIYGYGYDIINCTFTQCSAQQGGAIFSENYWDIINTTFTKCSATQKFGAIYLYEGGKILNCKFEGNTAPKYPNWYTLYPIITTITASDLKTVYTANSYYSIKVYDTTAKLVDGTKVVIKLNGKTFKTITTKKGIAKFKVTQTPGTYKLTITALKNTVTKTLTVKHLVTLKTVKVKKSAKKLTLQANLAKVNGKYLKNKQVTFKFNGKTYKAKTNSKGIAKVTIKSSVLKKLKVGKKITYQATYLKDTVKKTVKVQK